MSNTNGFTKNADLYRTSQAHSELEDLEQSLEHLPAVAGLEVLDVATGTGHTAFFFARKQAHTFGVDINEEMLRVAQEESDSKSLSVRFLKCPVEDLMFDNEKFDLVTCRLAAHHFASPGNFLSEAHRVLRKGGHLLLIDNVVQDGDKEASDWINEYETRRDSTHQRCLSPQDWKSALEEVGFSLISSTAFPKKLQYDPWMERMSKETDEKDALWEDLMQSPESVRGFLKPKVDSKGERSLRLNRQIIVAQKS